MELILFNGAIYTMDKDKPQVTAVAINNGIIESTGTDNEILALKTENTKLIDLKGKCVIPGLNDSHLHLISYGTEQNQVPLNHCRSIKEMQECLKEFIEENQIPQGTYVLGQGWNQDYFEEKRFPAKEDLDTVSKVHPIVLSRACRHAVAVNSCALELAGIDKKTENPEGGEILRNSAGEAAGILTEEAVKLVEDKILDAYTVEDLKNIILKVQEEFLSYGITSLQSDDFAFGSEKVTKAFRQLCKEGLLKIRVNQQCRVKTVSELEKILAFKADKNIEQYYKHGTIKVFIDGSLGARTAYMAEDYQDNPGNRGIPVMNQEALDAIVSKAHRAGRQVSAHAIGDGAIAMFLDSVERAYDQYGHKGIRHGVVHCQITDQTILERIARLGVMAIIQPIFLHYDLHIANDRVGNKKAATSYNFNTLYKKGVVTALGTDCPIEHFNPFHNLYCAVTRKDLTGFPPEGFYPEENMNIADALYSYTVNCAYISNEELLKGRIKAGMFGDIVVLDRDIMAIAPDEMKDISVEMTVSGGKIVYKKE